MTRFAVAANAPIVAAIERLPERLRPLARQLAGTLAVSGTAAMLDFSIYWTLLGVIGISALAAAIGYLSGAVLHYSLSSRVVFSDRLGARGLVAEAPAMGRFLLTVGCGLVVTVATVGLLADVLAVHPLIAKVIAAGASFTTVFTSLRTFVFKKARPAPHHGDRRG